MSHKHAAKMATSAKAENLKRMGCYLLPRLFVARLLILLVARQLVLLVARLLMTVLFLWLLILLLVL